MGGVPLKLGMREGVGLVVDEAAGLRGLAGVLGIRECEDVKLRLCVGALCAESLVPEL